MRVLFPTSILVGWKYELVGTREDALAKAKRQIEENRTDACVVNGRAFGSGFGFCQPDNLRREFRDKTELVRFLSSWAEERLRIEVEHFRSQSPEAERAIAFSER
jgi:phosphopantothenoylcysteine decarboxylase/phosphopantothenate--cysteine ligase